MHPSRRTTKHPHRIPALPPPLPTRDPRRSMETRNPRSPNRIFRRMHPQDKDKTPLQAHPPS
ncbi:hypothetical protein DL98DRAFT_520896 [Cadophora sp. DSE1049]|nr:hypothetical protein DL98DRAFT_520896 [Cadophora sp. DSE1049]